MTNPPRAQAGELSPARSNSVSSIIHWLLFLALLGGQFLLFHRHATRDVIWAYPQHCDQAVYLEHAYDTHLRMIHDGFARGLAFGAGFNGGDPSPNGALMHLQAAILFRVIGPSRLAALTLIFLYFAAFQAFLFSTLRAITGRWSIAWIGLGLLLAARTTFQSTGGIMDFRPDLPAMCLFGIFLCCVLRSNVFERPGWSIAAGILAACTMALRFLTLAYFIPIFGLILILLLIGWIRIRRGPEADAIWRQRLRNLVIAGIVGSILIGPVLLHHKDAISHYYLRLHAAGEERYERAAMFHVREIGASLQFYPQSLYLHHCGLIFLGVAIALLAVGLLTPAKSRSAAIANGPDRRLAIAVTLIMLLVPLAALTWDVDKNPSVGDIMLPSVLWLVLLLARFRLNAAGEASPWRPRTGCIAMAVVSIGIGVQIFAYLHPSELTRHREQVNAILAMYDAIGDSAAEHGWTDPVVADDAFSEYQFTPTMDVTIYERHGRLIHTHEALANGLLARSHEQIFNAVQRADFVLLSEPLYKRDVQDSFERSTQAAHGELLDYCQRHLRRLYDCPAMGRNITLFVRDTRQPS